MLKNISNSLLAIILLTAFYSCKTKRDIIKSDPSARTTVIKSKSETLNVLSSNSAKYSTLSIKSKANVNIAGNENDVSLNIKIRQGKAIWVSVTAIAGLEIARVLITPDSIKVRNGLESTYIKKPFSYLYDFTNSEVTFSTLESILAGNPQKEVVTEKSDLSIKDNQLVLKRIVESLIYTLQFNELHKVVLTSLQDEAANQTLFVSYADFIKVEDQVFPHLVNIKSNVERKNVVIDLKYNRVGINEAVEMPFSIPKSFTAKD